MVGWRSNVSVGGKHLVLFMKNFFLLEPPPPFTSFPLVFHQPLNNFHSSLIKAIKSHM